MAGYKEEVMSFMYDNKHTQAVKTNRLDHDSIKLEVHLLLQIYVVAMEMVVIPYMADTLQVN